jgi:hypothetical protein
MNISSDITWTSPLIVAIIAYLDWLSNPIIEKKMFENNMRIRWYRTVESIESTINILGPHTKLRQNNNWTANNRDKKIGAATVVGLGIINISFVSNLNKSARI